MTVRFLFHPFGVQLPMAANPTATETTAMVLSDPCARFFSQLLKFTR